ncbi:hypothetical protein ACFL2V_04205 [Pseudomonadota bacterium]
MKKLLYTIGFLMFATLVVQPTSVLGQEPEQYSSAEEDVPYSTARLFSKLAESGGFDPNADWTKSFGTTDEEEVGQHMYYVIMNKVQNQPAQEANSNVSNKYAMTQAELTRILHNDYSPIIDRKEGLTQQEAQEKVAEIQQKHKEELELLTLKAKVGVAVETSEMFANDDLSDSGFDLITDLRIIEEILFLHTQPIEVGGTWTPDFGGGGGGGASAEEEEDAAEEEEDAGGADALGAAVPGTDPSQTPGTASGVADGDVQIPVPGTGTTGTIDDDAGVNPNSCFDDNEYGDAFDRFEDQAQTDPNFNDNAGITGPTVPGAPGTDATYTPGSGPFAPGTGSAQAPLGTDDFFPDLEEGEEIERVSPAAAGDWQRELPCNDIFCLTINFVMEPATSSYQDPDNCIACHAEKINDTLKKVINHSLLPSKAPGNLGESAQCKKAAVSAFGTVNMNFYAIAMPVLTPINDDLIWGTSLEEEWYNFCSQTAYFPFDTCKAPDAEDPPVSQYETPPSFPDVYAQRAITMAAENTSQSDVFEEIVSAEQLKFEQVQQVAATGNLEEAADQTIMMINPIITELNQMNAYFITIRDILHSLHEEVEGIAGPQACTDLKNKKECE